MVVLGLLPNENSIESLLNNLAEQDFDTGNVSVILQDTAKRDQVAGDKGPLKGVTPGGLGNALKRYRLKGPEVNLYLEKLKAGGAVLAIEAGGEWIKPLKETLRDYKADQVLVVSQ